MAPPRCHECQFSGKTNNLDFFGTNLPKNEFCRQNFEILSPDSESGRNFKILSPDSESAAPIYHVCQFLGKTDNSEFFGLNLGKLPNYGPYFGSYNVEGVAESWVEAEMSRVELDAAG